MTYHQPPTEKELVAIAHVRDNLKGTVLDDDTNFNTKDEKLLLRFVRHKDGNAEKALAHLEAAIAWRRETKPHQIKFEEVEEFAKMNVAVPLGMSKIGVPVSYFRPRSGIKIPSEKRVRYNLWMMEEFARRGYTEIVFVCDFDQATSQSSDDTKTRETMEEIRRNYYPLLESLILIINLPLILRAIFAIMIKFMSDAQQKTMKSGLKPKHLLEYIDASQLHVEYGGEATPDASSVLATFPAARNA